MDNDAASSAGPGGGGLATPPGWSAPRLRALGVIIMTAPSSVPGGGGLATPPSWSAPRLLALRVIIMTSVWLRRVVGLHGHEHRQRHRLRCQGAAQIPEIDPDDFVAELAQLAVDEPDDGASSPDEDDA